MERISIWFENWIAAWFDLICGLITVVSLGAWRPWWDFEFRVWASKRRIRRRLIKSREVGMGAHPEHIDFK